MAKSPPTDRKGCRPLAPWSVARRGHSQIGASDKAGKQRWNPSLDPYGGEQQHTTNECQKLKKALHELANKGQIDRSLKRGPRFLEQELATPSLRDEECSTEVVATIAGGYAKDITRAAWKAQLRIHPTGTIRLSVHFGDKSKSKSPEVDFLVVDVPTAYNVIIGRPTLHRVKAVGLRGYTSGSLPSVQPSSSDAPASASKGLVASSSTVAHSDEGGINSTSSGSRSSATTCSRLSTKRRLHNTGHLRIRLQGLARPYGGRQVCSSGFADSPGPHQSRPSPADAVSIFHGPLGPPRTSHYAFGIGKRVLPAVGTLRRPSPPGERPLPLPSPPRTPLGGPKPLG
ncbi:LOW QUALITY PROTEIN: hypothetical protein Cgig2_023785 [Carnegiea gigantea]|uniref:Uncharacterized protein n=1 Tax=Carnegiea gigantea TaxID=171969 RepID=A0A9Q1JRB4_9CARY|nr:LOW QUALITY PROTEIN: hypothetical protein Cgig2_023785 [Carnegiea gigantea]